MRSREQVTCQDCGVQWEMETRNIPRWGGRCRSCALRERHGRRYRQDPPGQKTCTQCGAVKPVAEFYQQPGGPAAACKVCHNAAVAIYKKTERGRQVRDASTARCAERVRAGKVRYYARHREAVLQRVQARYRADPDTAKAYAQRHRLAHLDTKREGDAAYYAANAARIKMRVRQWAAAHPERGQVYSEQRRALKRVNGGTFTQQEWAAIKARQAYRCLMCGRQEPEIRLSIDHIVPLSRGGRHAADNIQGLCRSCNSRKHTKTLDLR